jgi:hypothetical protein
MYDYKEAVKNDVIDYINDHYTREEIKENIMYHVKDRFIEELHDDMWTADSVTGNASGSYTFNTYKAEEYLCHNMELLKEALEEFGCGIDYLEKGAEACDVTIRCYLLYSAISEALEEIEEEMEE